MEKTKNIIFSIIFLFNNIMSQEKLKIDFLIIGAQKSGTTSLYYYLSKHPQIRMSKYKEINFFNFNYDKGINWYYEQFHVKINGNEIRGEASPNYSFNPLVPKRVFELFPKIKLIMILRDPVDRAFSQYKHNLRYKIEKIEDTFENSIKKSFISWDEEKKCDSEIIYSRLYPYNYISRGVYIDQIKNWRNYFPKEQFLIILFDDFVKNTLNVLDKICDFLAISKFKLDKYEKFNENNEYKNLKLNPSTKQMLSDFYSKYNKELERYLNIKLPW